MSILIKEIITHIKGVSADSRLIDKDYAYVAIKGANFNGENFIDDALKRGAKYIIVQGNSLDLRSKQNFIYVENSRETLSKIASTFYLPQPKNIVAITGTNGKTSTAHFFMQLNHFNSLKSAAVGTLGLLSFDDLTGIKEFLNHNNVLTSPDAVTTNKILFHLKTHDFTHIAIEASSHGLSQYRLDGINFKAAAFTNLSRDHLDYHGTIAAYFSAKKRLFTEVIEHNALAILNSDIPEFNELFQIAKARGIKVIEYGKKARDIKIIQHQGGIIKLSIFGRSIESTLQLTGEFQIYNLSCAISLSMACGLCEEQIVNALPLIQAVTGRMEKISVPNLNNAVYIDYAHTPDALQRVLKDLKSVCEGRLIVVFGCGGGRDYGKRELMGITAEELADIAIVTDDNPRNEDPATIRKDIMRSMKKPIEIMGRKEAIIYGLSLLKPKDILLIAGKGHENYQIIGNNKIYFSDRETVLQAVLKTSA